MNYWANLKGHTEARNPTTKVFLPCWESERVKNKCFAWIAVDIARKMGLDQVACIPTVPLTVTAPWLFPSVFVDFYLLENSNLFKDTGNLPSIVEERIQTGYQSYVAIYTDGSKDPSGRTAYAFTIPSLQVSINKRTSDYLAVYTVELIAIASALQWVEQVKLNKVILCSDSSSVLLSIQSFSSRSRQDIVNEIYETLFRLQMLNIIVSFMWVPAHRGIKGNETADSLAKEASKQENIMDILFSKTEIKTIIKSEMIRKWQNKWNNGSTGRHLYNIQKDVGRMRLTGRNTLEDSIISRLRLGHTRLNKTLQLIGKHPTGLCEYCQEEESVEHVLCHCRKYNTEREILRRTLQDPLTVEQILGQSGVWVDT